MAQCFETFISCEHAGNRIPPRYQQLFAGQEKSLDSHLGFDPGASDLAASFSKALGCRLFTFPISRLLIEANRSLYHHRLFSAISRSLAPAERTQIIERYYRPYRQRIEAFVGAAVRDQKRVLHISVHTFTPVLKGEVRTADVSFLYDPKRTVEKQVARSWKEHIMERNSRLRIRFNYPYLGTADGMTTHLRRLHDEGSYAGIEIEVNQRFSLGSRTIWMELQEILTQTLLEVCRPAVLAE